MGPVAARRGKDRPATQEQRCALIPTSRGRREVTRLSRGRDLRALTTPSRTTSKRRRCRVSASIAVRRQGDACPPSPCGRAAPRAKFQILNTGVAVPGDVNVLQAGTGLWHLNMRARAHSAHSRVSGTHVTHGYGPAYGPDAQSHFTIALVVQRATILQDTPSGTTCLSPVTSQGGPAQLHKPQGRHKVPGSRRTVAKNCSED